MDEMRNDEAIDALVRRKLESQKRGIVEGSDEWTSSTGSTTRRRSPATEVMP